MHLIEIVIDGFKSYSVRTSVDNLDPQFNAITGLNGSGKSNILDAICFVMGISRMALIRVEKMQELVYNGGKSSVTKASVTLKFDNSDKNMAPPNYIDCDTITVTRTIENNKVKCFINGKTETQERVRDLFTSVKLNVNNPHFLIMQGRITKVINMKPQEVLQLLEEASGVSQYQVKKEQAKDVIKKKDLKILETNNILEHDVMPQFAALTEDKKVFDQFNQLLAQFEEKKKLKLVYDFVYLQQLVNDEQGMLHKINSEMNALQTRIQRERNELSKSKEELERVLKLNSTADADRIEQLINQTAKKIIEDEASVKALERQQEQFNQLKIKIDDRLLKLNDEETELTRKSEKCRERTQQLQKDFDQKKEELWNVDQNLKKLESGKTSWEEQLKVVKQQVENLDQQLEENEQQRKLIIQGKAQHKQRLDQSVKELQRLSQDTQGDQQKQKMLEDNITSLFNELQLGQSLQNQIQLKETQLNQLRQKQRQSVDNPDLQQSKYFVDFQYQNPYNDFDRRQVYGRISTLFKVKDVERYGTALSEIAGAKLRSIAVEKSVTAKDILNSKLLQSREYFEPLDVIQSQRIPLDKVEEIKRKTDGRASLAIDLIEFDPKFKNLMEKVFGTSFVTDTEDVARMLSKSFNCVTLAGDSYKNNGLLSGGHNKAGNRLLMIQQYLHKDQLFRKQGQEIDRLGKEIDTLNRQQEQYQERKRQLEKLENQLRIVKESQQSVSQLNQAQDLVNKLTNQARDFEEDLDKVTQRIGELKQEQNQLNQQLKQSGKDDQQKFLKQRLQNLKDQRQDVEDKLKKLATQQTQFEIKGEELAKERNSLIENLNSESAGIHELAITLKQVKVSLDDLKKVITEYRFKLEQEQRSQANKQNEISELQVSIDRKIKQIKDMEEQADQKGQEAKNFENQRKIAQENLLKLKHEYPSIEHDQRTKNRVEAERVDPEKLKEELRQLEASKDDLKKRVNVNIELMFEKTQKWHQELLFKKETLIQNKLSIQDTIMQLDIEKNKDLQKTVKEVDRNLADIFSTLLPKASANLKEVYEDETLTGLHLKVSFNGVEKESLTELSGGQRSLLALSLILALLKYQPAPLYILDEIDSALDLSHTQNIGIMIKKYFQTSQFLIVSLKDGLFQNANVLYKVQFKENRSMVNRLAIK